MSRNTDHLKLHRFMLTFVAAFKTPDGKQGMRYINSTISRQVKNVPLGHIKKAQDAVAMQLQYFGIPVENILDVTFMSASYLGLMNEKEFTDGLSGEQAAAASLYTEGDAGDDTETEQRQNPFEIN